MRKIAFALSILLLLVLNACGTSALPLEETPVVTGEPTTPDPTQANGQTPPNEVPPTIEPSGGSPTLPTNGEVKVIPQIETALEGLAQQERISVDEITLVSLESVQWRNSCLGMENPGEMCLQVITPGYRAIVRTPEGLFAVHTDASGQSYRMRPAEKIERQEAPVLVWEQSGGFAGICEILTVSPSGQYYRTDCENGQVIALGMLNESQQQTLNNLLRQYGVVEWETKPPPDSADFLNQRLILNGSGSGDPSEEEIEQIIDFVRELNQQVQDPPTS